MKPHTNIFDLRLATSSGDSTKKAHGFESRSGPDFLSRFRRPPKKRPITKRNEATSRTRRKTRSALC